MANPYDASDPDTLSVHCAVCENLITNCRWFARIRHEEWTVALCCPLCTETFERAPHNYARRVATYAQCEPSGGSA